MAEKKVRVLLVDDEESLRVPLKKFLENNFGYQVDAVASSAEALQQVKEANGHYDVVLIDDLLIHASGEEARPTGIELMREIKQQYPDIEAIVFTGWSGLPDWDKERAVKALQAGAFRYLEKPFDNDVLAMLIHAAAQQVRLREISRAILSERELKGVLERVTSAACSLSLADEAQIVLLDQTTGKIAVCAMVGLPEQVWTEHFKNQDLSQEIIRSGRLAYVPDTMQDERVTTKVINARIRSFLGLPIPSKGGNLGVLYVYSQQPRRFDDGSTVAVLQTMAAQAGVAIANAQAFHQLCETREQLDRLIKDSLDIIPTEPNQVLQVMVNTVCQITGAWRAVVLLVDEGAKPKVLAQSGFDIHLEPATTIRPEGISYQVIQTRKPRFFPDIRTALNEVHPKMIEQGVQAAGCLPLVLRHQAIGVLWIHFRKVHSFSDAEQQALQIYASLAAIAYDYARRLEQARRARKAAAEIARMTTIEDLKRTLKALVHGVQDATGCDAVALYRYNQTTSESEQPPAMVGMHYPKKAMHLDVTVWDSVDEPYIVQKVDEDSLFKNSSLNTEEKIKSLIAVPLQLGNQKVGIMFVNFRSLHTFTVDEIAIIQLFADQAAVAIHNALRYEDVRKQAITLETLYEAGKALAGTLALADILSQIVKQAWQFTGRYGKRARFSHLALKEGRWLRFKAAYPPECLPELQAKVGDIDLHGDRSIGVTGRAVKTGEAQLIKDVTQDPDYIAYDPATRSELAVPIKLGEEVLGVINVEHPCPNAFDEQDERSLTALAVEAALAIRNAHLYAELEQKYAELHQIKGFVGSYTALDWMRMVSNAWGHIIKREVGMSLVSIELIRQAIQKNDLESTLKELADLKGRLEGIREIPITAPLSAEDTVSSVAINQLVEAYLRHLWNNRRYNVELLFDLQPGLDKVATVRASPAWLRRGIEIVVDNAVQAMLDANSYQKKLKVTTRLRDNYIEILIQDTGPGIPKELIPKLFEEPIDKPSGSRGAGVGLVLARTIFGAYRGSIQVRETGSDGTLIEILLPIEDQNRRR